MGRELSQPPKWAVRTPADRLALERGYYWDQRKANHVVTFTETFFKSPYVNGGLTPIKLQPLQKRFLQSVYAWRKPNGNARFRTANLHCPKKLVGKTLLVQILSFYELFGGNNSAPWIITGAASAKNSEQVYDGVSYAVKHSPFADFADDTPSLKRIIVEDLAGKFQSVAAAGDKLHGPQISLCVLDESHVVPEGLRDSLWLGPKARPNGLSIAISTAGNDISHWYYALYRKSKRILSGQDMDLGHYAEVYEMDQDGDPLDKAQWCKANPTLGKVPWADIEVFESELEFEKSISIGRWLNFMQLSLGLWCAPEEAVWIWPTDYEGHKADFTEDELKKYPCAMGVDLSEVCDPSSVSICHKLPDNKFYVRSWAWTAAQGVKEREASQLPKYRQFIEEGSMFETTGNMIDKDMVLRHVIEKCKTYNPSVIRFDPRSAWVMMQDLESMGYRCESVTQNFKSFNDPMASFARAYKEGRILHDGSTWLKYCLGNVRIEVDKNGLMAPHKARSVDKIDGAISCLLAYAPIMGTTAAAPRVFRL